MRRAEEGCKTSAHDPDADQKDRSFGDLGPGDLRLWLQFGPLTYQPIEFVFISSNQRALWSCLYHLTSQLGEGCSMNFVRFVLLIRWKTCVWNRFGPFSPMGFWRIYRSAKCVRNFPRSTHMFICWRARKRGTGMKAQASCPNKEFEEGQ